jgi:hypothetical protein
VAGIPRLSAGSDLLSQAMARIRENAAHVDVKGRNHGGGVWRDN